MKFECKHLSYSVSDKKAMKEFYADKLGLELLDDGERFFAVRAGDVRFSFFAGGNKYTIPEDAAGMGIILKTENINDARAFVLGKDITLLNDIIEAPNFMKFFTLEDPDGNIVHIGEYLADPFLKKI
jgi:catechol 2,3-dioxygenase-like lactoylglutathione lyase family enzyme